jgi:hypothetical protein
MTVSKGTFEGEGEFTIANSGSMLGSSPSSPSPPNSGSGRLGSKRMGEPRTISDSSMTLFGGTETRCLRNECVSYRTEFKTCGTTARLSTVRTSTHDSPAPAASTIALNFSSFPFPSSPNVTTSTSTLFFLNRFPNFTKLSCESSSGDPTNTTIRCLWFLFSRCLRASWAIWTEVRRSEVPPMVDRPRAERSLPMSLVGVTSSDGLGGIS